MKNTALDGGLRIATLALKYCIDIKNNERCGAAYALLVGNGSRYLATAQGFEENMLRALHKQDGS